MPNGRVHASITVLSAGYLAAATTYAFTQVGAPAPIFIAVAGCLTGIMLSPDLDINKGNISYRIMKTRLGFFAYWLWRIYWWPYSKFIPHRSAVSHLPILSTFLRLLYCFWWLIPIWPRELDLTWLIWFSAGLAVSDFNHWFLDLISGVW